MAPAAFSALAARALTLRREHRFGFAMVSSVLANIYRDSDRHPEPFTPADFMPGARGDVDDLLAFAEEVERGEIAQPDPEALEEFKARMAAKTNLSALEPRRTQ